MVEVLIYAQMFNFDTYITRNRNLERFYGIYSKVFSQIFRTPCCYAAVELNLKPNFKFGTYFVLIVMRFEMRLKYVQQLGGHIEHLVEHEFY